MPHKVYFVVQGKDENDRFKMSFNKENFITITWNDTMEELPIVTKYNDKHKSSYYLFDKIKIFSKENKTIVEEKKDHNINICISSDDNYSKYAGIVIASILYNAELADNITFYILDGGISGTNKEKIQSLKAIKQCSINFVQIDPQLFYSYSAMKTHEYLSIATFYRLKLGTLLPNVDKIIYLDCDTVVNTSLSTLFGVELCNDVIAGVQDINKRMLQKNKNYINAGVLLINLEKFRRENIEGLLESYTTENIDKITMGDQEVINNVLQYRIKIIDEEWNVQSSNFTNRSSYTNNPKIIHFVSKRKPWHFGSFSYHKEYYFKYLQLTPWALKNEEKDYWYRKNQWVSLIKYLKYRPLFLLRPRFYVALYHTYLQELFDYKQPIIKSNTFLVWEPCSQSHAEVVPGYVKYLLDLGFHVSVLMTPKRIEEGLFDRFKNHNISLNIMSQKEIKRYFKKSKLSDVEGVLITTAAKLCDGKNHEQCYQAFNKNADRSKIYFVEHEIVNHVDNQTLKDSIITLRQMDYKGANTTVVNPHYFGDVKFTQKNEITNFVTVGKITDGKKNTHLFIDTVKKLHEKGINNFKITVIGKGRITDLPYDLRPYFDIKGRLNFNEMYNEIEKADFILSAYNDTPAHIRYITTGTSGNFQLVYGFLKPIIIKENFAPINGFDGENSILYTDDEDFYNAMLKGINLDQEEYVKMQNNLQNYVNHLCKISKENLGNLVRKKKEFTSV